MKPIEAKRLYRAYRLMARKLYENAGMVDSKHITVTESCTVHRIADGAFVQMLVWIPREAITADIHELVLQHERERIEH